MTQKQKIVSVFLQGKSLTTYTAAVSRITTKLPTRIGEIEKEIGVRFERKKIKSKKIAEHLSYSIGKASKVKLNKYLKKVKHE